MASDNKYAPWLGILIMSIINKSHDKQLRFHIIDGGISETNRNKITSLSDSQSIEFCWYQPDANRYEGLPIERYGLASYYRMSLGTILPSDISRVIYLDCDMMATRDIATLYQKDLGHHIIGAVEDISAPRLELGFAPHEYFNSGSIVMDLTRWREEGIEQQLFSVMQTHAGNIKYPDQDALNIVFQSRWQRLPLEWNFQPGIWRRSEKKQYGPVGTTSSDYKKALKNPAIIHFLARRKPWRYGCIHPLKKVYLDYLKQSPWADLYPEPGSLKDVLKYYSGIDKLFKQQKRWLQMKRFL
ncbi:glycosyltransferase family 8 protein [Kushneria pakistanensis]|nr:glycosyltransferase family 8 protein [Kushneria pakistanensis]